MANETSSNVTTKGLIGQQTVDLKSDTSYHVGPVVINPINVNYNGLYFP